MNCHFTGRISGLVPGMFLQSEIESSGRKVTAVREDAVVRYGNKEYIFVTEGKNQFRQLEVLIPS